MTATGIPDNICSVEDCERLPRTRGLCSLHYTRWQKHGDPNWVPVTQADRFWAKVNKDGQDGCWLWTGANSVNGYGRVYQNGKVYLAHRVSYEMAHGPIPAGLEIDHTCAVRACVNPTHLQAVTGSLNVRRADNARTHCKQGHLLDAAKLLPQDPDNPMKRIRRCKVCRDAQRAKVEQEIRRHIADEIDAMRRRHEVQQGDSTVDRGIRIGYEVAARVVRGESDG